MRHVAFAVTVAALVGIAAAQPAATPFVNYERGSSESLGPTYHVTISSRGEVVFVDADCKTSKPAIDTLATDELQSLRDVIAAAKLASARPTYLPTSESDFPGHAQITLSVVDTKIVFDQAHAPASILDIASAMETLLVAHHWLRDAARLDQGCYCSQPQKADPNQPLGVRAYASTVAKNCT